MINEEKIKIMTKLAMYEKTEGKKNLQISRYFRTDYIGLALIKNFFMVTIGYGLILATLAGYFSDYLMNNIHKMNLVNMGIYIAIGYGVVLIVYTLITYILYSVRYYRAKKSVKKYYEELTRLNKIYGREEKKTSGRTPQGGRKK